MDAQQIRKLQPMLSKYLAEFDDCFSRSEPADSLRVYVNGQLSDLPRKSIEPIADRAGVPPRTLQQFLSRAAWDQAWMADRLMQIVARDHSHPMSIGIIDRDQLCQEGRQDPRRQAAVLRHQRQGRQLCGLRASELCGRRLPHSAGRRVVPAAGVVGRPRAVPDGGHPRSDGPPPQVADRLGTARSGGGQRGPPGVGGSRRGLRRGAGVPVCMDDRGQRYVVEVPSIFHGWLRQPEVLQKQHHGRRKPGRQPRYPRLKVKNLPTIEVRNMLKYCEAFRKQAWERFHIKPDFRIGTPGQ